MKKKYTLKYRRLTVRLDFNPRKNYCECCGKNGKLDYHHWIYSYKTKDVRKNPSLAAMNGSTLCFVCHNLANSLKHLIDNREKINKLSELMGYQIGVII